MFHAGQSRGSCDSAALVIAYVEGAVSGLGGELTRRPKIANTTAGYVQNKKVIQNVEIIGLAIAGVDHPDSLGRGRCGRGHPAPDRAGPWRS